MRCSGQRSATSRNRIEPKLVGSLNDKSLPKDRNTVADGLYVLPLDSEWSIYRLEISD